MANKKFSQFNPLSAPTATTELAGFDGSNNIRIPASALGGGGKEPYIDDTFVNTNAINTAGRNQNQNQSHQKHQSHVVPFMLQQDVTLKEVAMTQTNSNSLGTVGYLGLYEYASKSGGNFTFDKVYQETQTFDLSGALANSVQRITLTTSQTLEAGKIYVIAVIHADIIQTVQQTPFYAGYAYLNPSKILGTISTSTTELYRSLSATQATPVGGVLPSSITYTGQSNFALSKGGYYTLTLQNA